MVKSGGRKDDEQKNRLDLIPGSAMIALGRVLTYGAEKYGPHNWRAGLAWHRPYGAALRHLNAWWEGEDLDTESGYSHLWHAMCELAFLVEYEQTHKELDDRYATIQRQAASKDGFELVRTTVPRADDSQRSEVRHACLDSGTQEPAFRNSSSNTLPPFDWGMLLERGR